jgi:PleD family two-component response regulator
VHCGSPEDESLETVIHRADEALLQAKEQRRNQARVWRPD